MSGEPKVSFPTALAALDEIKRLQDGEKSARRKIERLTRERDEALAAERERCAKIAETQYPQPHKPVGWFAACQQIAAAIRGGGSDKRNMRDD